MDPPKDNMHKPDTWGTFFRIDESDSLWKFQLNSSCRAWDRADLN
jgi:hypothetical protein